MSCFEVSLLSFFDMFMIINIVLETKDENNKSYLFKGILGIIFGSIVGVSKYFIDAQVISLTFNIIAGLIIIRHITESNIKESIITYIYSLTILYTVQILITMIIQMGIKNYEYTFKNGLIVQVITTIVVMLVIKRTSVNRIYALLMGEGKWFRLIMINIFMVYYVLVILWHVNFEGLLELTLGVLILIVLVLLINMIMMTHGYKNQIMKEKMKMYTTYIPVIENIIEEIRSKQHDYHNHIQALQMLNDIQVHTSESKKYIDKIKKDEVWSKLIRLENKILMAFLYSKFISAQKEDIYINYDISNYLISTGIQDYDLIEIFGILIDNALEATIENGSDNVYISIGFNYGVNIIETRNKSKRISSDEMQLMFEDKRKTDITQRKGYGFRKIKRLLEKNNSTIFAQYDTVENEMMIRLEIPSLL